MKTIWVLFGLVSFESLAFACLDKGVIPTLGKDEFFGDGVNTKLYTYRDKKRPSFSISGPFMGLIAPGEEGRPLPSIEILWNEKLNRFESQNEIGKVVPLDNVLEIMSRGVPTTKGCGYVHGREIHFYRLDNPKLGFDCQKGEEAAKHNSTYKLVLSSKIEQKVTSMGRFTVRSFTLTASNVNSGKILGSILSERIDNGITPRGTINGPDQTIEESSVDITKQKSYIKSGCREIKELEEAEPEFYGQKPGANDNADGGQ